jgi:hypothetical protein
VRTRGDLADLINSAADPVLVKQEETESNWTGGERMDLAEEEGDVEFIGEFDGDEHSVYYGDGDEEEDESLLEEQEYEEQEGAGEEEQGDGMEHEEEHEAAGPTSEAGQNVVVHAQLVGEQREEGGEQEGGNAGGGEQGGGDANGEEDQQVGQEGGGDQSATDSEEDDAVVVDPVNPNLRPDPRFFVVRSMLSGSMEPRLLNRKMKLPEADPGFLVEGDERMYRNANQSCTKKKINSSASFLPTGTCHTCLSGEHDAWIGEHGQPVLIVAADQHFPANLPTDGEGECIRILRIENGSLAEIAKELSGLAPSDGLLPGTVIMLGAPQQLAVVSVEFYAFEWKKARNYLKADLGDIVVLPLIPLSATGFTDSRIIRGLIDLSAWLGDMEEHELKLLRNTRKSFEAVYFSKVERGPGWADLPVNMALPVSLSGSSNGTTAYATGSWGARPTAVKPLTAAGEKHWIEKLVGEANRELRSGLSLNICYNRTLSAIKRQANYVGKMSMLTVGASNSARTAAALKKKGVAIMEMGRNGWAVSESSIDALLEQLQIVASKDDILVLQCLDSKVFLEVDSSGGVQCPKRGEDGKVHVLGRITVAKDIMLDILLDQLDPVFVSRKDSLIVLVCPLTRFLISCCDSHERKEGAEEDGKRLLRELGTLRREIKSRLIKKGYDNVRMVDPLEVNGAASSVAAAKAIMRDQVHMHSIGYARLAEDIKELAHSWLLGRKRKGSGSDRPEPKRMRMDPAADKKAGAGGGGGRGKGGKGRGGKGRGKGNGKK